MSGEQTGIRILHVDDEPSFLALTKAFLEREHEDFCVDTALSAEEGLERLKSGRYDVVLSDYQMPMTDGLEFLQKLREPGNMVPFIMFTGKGREEVAIEALNRGANRYIQKGVDIGSMFGTLAHSIQDVVAKNRAGVALKESEERYRLLFNKGRDAVFLHEVSVDGVPGKILDVNDTACDLLGYTKEELVQLSHLDLVAPEQMNRVPALSEKLQENKSNLFEIVAVAKDGKKVNFEINHHLFNLNGQPTVLAIARDITNRNEAAEALRELEAKYSAVVENSLDGIVIIQEGLLKFVNRAYSALMGYTIDDVIDKNFLEMVTPEFRKLTQKRYTDRMEGKEPPNVYEIALLRKDGGIIPVELNATIIKYEGGPADLVFIRGITDRKRAEEALRASEEKYRTMIESTGTGMCILEDDTTISFVNNEYERITGYTKEEVEGKVSWTEHIVKEDLEEMKKRHKQRRVESNKLPTEYEFRLITKSGAIKDILLNVTMIPGTKKSLASLIDITNRKQATQELEKRRIYLESVLGCAPDAIITLDAQHHILEWNSGAEKMFGYSPEEAKGRNLDDLVTGSHASAVDEATRLTRQVLAGESVPPTETVRYQKDGTPVDVIAAGSPIKIGNEVIGVVAVYTDLTERKQAEDALLKSEEKFKAIVEDAPFGISIMNPDMSFEYFNAEFTTLFGYTLEDLPGKKSWFEKAYPDEEYRKKVVTAWKENVIENPKVGEITPRVFKVKCKDGREKVINFRTVLFENGKHFVTYQDITTQTKAEEALKDSEREHQILLDHVPVSLFHIDNNSQFVRVNEALAKHYGMRPEDFIGKSTSELFPEEAESFIESDKKVLECGEPHIGEIRKIIQPQGVRWVQLDKVPLKDADGNVTGIIGFELDITDRKRAVEGLRNKEKEHKIVLDSVPVGIFHIDANGKFIEVNEALAEQYQLTAEQMIGKSSRELFPDVAEEYLKSDNEVLARGEPQIGLTRKIKTPDGVRWVRLDKVPIKDADGIVTGIIGFELDITKRMQTQEELHNAQKEFRDIIEFLPDATFVVDQDKKVIAWNRAMEEMTGIQKEDMLGKGDYEYALPFYEERRPILTDLVFASDKEIESRYTQVGKKGYALFAEIFAAPLYGGKGAYLWGIATPLFDSEGKVIGAIESIRDISDRKQAEKDRKRLVEELEAKNTELERFTYTVSHDLRSPLVTIQGFTDMAREDLERDEREKAKNDLKYVANAATKMDRLLQDTLQLSRIGCVANPPEYVPFGDLVEDALEQTAGELKANNIDVSVAEDFPTVHVDRMRIVEVLVNFITNSIKYRGEHPTPKIEIGYRREGEETVFFVQDNGIGIDKSAHEKVFELFYHEDKSGEGTGAGLAIVKRIIEVHKGRIWIESKKGTGTTVCFTLPVQ